MPNRTLAAAALAALLACRTEPPAAGPAASADPPASAATAAGIIGPASTSPATTTPATTTPEAARLAAPAAAPPVPVSEAVALIPGASTALGQDAQTTVDPAATFRVVLTGTFPDARLSLLDPGDAMLPSAGGREVGASTTLTLQPTAPLRPGTSYRLRVDGATTREVTAKDGTARAPVEFPILAAGEPPPEPKRSRAKKPRR